MSATIRGPEQTGQEFTAHHHRGNNHTQGSLSEKDVSRAEGQQDEHVDGASTIQDAQTGWEVSVRTM